MDMIHKPKHYCFSKFEPKDVIREWGLNFNLGSAVKYIARAGRKDDIIQDLKKAREFLTFEIEALEGEREKEDKPKNVKPGVYVYEKSLKDHVNCRCNPGEDAEPTIRLSDLLRMKASEFRELYRGKVIALGKTGISGDQGDIWAITELYDDRGSTLDVPHFPGTVSLRLERLKVSADMSTNEMALILRD